MNKICFAPLLLIITAGFALFASGQANSNELEHTARKITVKIVVRGSVKTPFGGTKTIFLEGTGFLLSRDGYVVTNRHVVFPEDSTYIDKPTISVHVPNNNGTISESSFRAAEIINTDEKHDFQMLKIDGTYEVAECEFATPAIDDEVYVFGYREGMSGDYTSSVGSVLPSQSVSGLTGKLLSEVSTRYGNSGSPVFSTQSKKIIGYVLQSAQVPKETVFNLTVFHRLLQIRELLPKSVSCNYSSSSCLTVDKRVRHSRLNAINGLLENCAGNTLVESNRAKVSVASLDGTGCNNVLDTLVKINSPQHPKGTGIPVKVTTRFSGNSSAFQWAYRPPDNRSLDIIHPTKEEREELAKSEEKVQVFEDVLRNGYSYEFDLVAAVYDPARGPISAAEFEIDANCN